MYDSTLDYTHIYVGNRTCPQYIALRIPTVAATEQYLVVHTIVITIINIQVACLVLTLSCYLYRYFSSCIDRTVDNYSVYQTHTLTS